MSTPPSQEAKPMDTDCTAEFSDIKVPRHCGWAAEVSMAMPGIMRAFMQKKKPENTSSTHGSGAGCIKVVMVMGSMAKNNIR